MKFDNGSESAATRVISEDIWLAIQPTSSIQVALYCLDCERSAAPVGVFQGFFVGCVELDHEGVVTSPIWV